MSKLGLLTFYMFLHFRFCTPSTDGHNSDRERPEIVDWWNHYVRDVIKAREDGKIEIK